MSKSKGNLYTLDELVAKGFSPMEVRYTLISGHYRSSLNFTMKGVEDSRSALAKLERGADRLLAAAGFSRAEFDVISEMLGMPEGDRLKRACEVGEAVPFGRMGTAADLTGMAIFLATPEADYIVAQTFGVDGGNWMA